MSSTGAADPGPKKLTLWPGVGLVSSNMIGAGVFLSAGFMAQSMGPGPLLLDWVAGGLLALLGATAYAEVARRVPRSGGEYRYLSTLMHPGLGYLAGWASLLVGFSAPLAADALAAGAFARALGVPAAPGLVGGLAIVLLTVIHAVGLRSSRLVQNSLAVLKAVLMGGFVLVGLSLGHNAWPTWQPSGAAPGFPVDAFASSLFYVGFAFSGWNAAIYASEEFAEPTRDVPRAMQLGCLLVGLLYLVVNWVFVANLDPTQAKAVFAYDSEKVTLAHVILKNLVGESGSRLASGVILLLLLSAMSAMTYTGPRVYAAMAQDGFLPKALAGQPGKPPVGSVILQGVLALIIVATHQLQDVLSNVGAILTLFAALTVLGLFKARFIDKTHPDIPAHALVAAGLYVLSACWMLYFGFNGKTGLVGWIGVVALVALMAYALSTRLKSKAG